MGREWGGGWPGIGRAYFWATNLSLPLGRVYVRSPQLALVAMSVEVEQIEWGLQTANGPKFYRDVLGIKK